VFAETYHPSALAEYFKLVYQKLVKIDICKITNQQVDLLYCLVNFW